MNGSTVPDWLADLAARYGDLPALRGVGGGPGLSHAGLAAEVARTAQALAGWGLGRGDVALVALPDGPGVLTAILAVASVAAALPMPELEQAEEFDRVLDAAPVRAVLMLDRPDASLARLARRRGLTVVTVAPGPDGALTLSAAHPRPPRTGRPAPEDDAILFRTAGTTATPRIIVVSHESLHRNASRLRDWVGFEPADRALCMMPAAHAHSLVRSALPVLLAGGEVAWASGFSATTAPAWIDVLRPTWISAAPAIHRGLIAAADSGWRPPPVRRIGTGSDSIRPEEVERLAALFGGRVLQFYAMTEAAPFIAMTPAAGPRGSSAAVGRVHPDWQVTILGGDGAALAAGATGEIALAGGQVNPVLFPDGTRAPCLDPVGRLRTGDIGRIDGEGFLFVEGRTDDVISRGAEKIVPAAVEAAVESHPAVARAIAFGLPDPVLGGRVAVVAELRDGAFADADALAAHAAARLSRSMVPERFFFAARIPTSPSGKVSRRGLAEILAAAPAKPDPPRSPDSTGLAEGVREILARGLNGAALDVADDFFAAGGDSLRALEALVEIEQVFGVSVPPATFTRTPTAAAIARTLAAAPLEAGETRLDAVQEGAAPGLLFAYCVDGRVGFARTIAAALGPGEGLATFHARPTDAAAAIARDLHHMAEDCARIALRAQPSGPFCLAGFSFGAHLALAIAQRLVARGRVVAFLAVVDDEADLHKRHFGVARSPPAERSFLAANKWAIHRAAAGFFAGRMTYFPAGENAADRYSDPTAGWGEVALGGVEVVEIEGSHASFEQAEGLSRLGPELAAAKRRALARPSGWARAPARPDAARARRLEARRAARAGDRDVEIAACRAAVAVGGDQAAWLQNQLAEVLFEAGDRPGAAAAARTAVACDAWPLQSLARLAPLMRKLGRRKFLDRVLAAAEAEPVGHPSVEVWRAEALRALGRTAAAEAALRRGLCRAPRHLRLRLRLAGVCERGGRLAEAATLLAGVVEDYPSLGFALQRLGKLRLATGEAEAAEVALRAALRLRDDDCTGWTLLSEALDRLGRPAAAAEARIRAASLSTASGPQKD